MASDERALAAHYSSRKLGSIWSLWTGVLAPPVIFLVALEAAYALVDTACRTDGTRSLVLHLVILVAIAATAALGFLSWRKLRETGIPPDDGGTVGSRSRFMAAWGVGASAFSLLLLVAQWLPTFFVGPCF